MRRFLAFIWRRLPVRERVRIHKQITASVLQRLGAAEFARIQERLIDAEEELMLDLEDYFANLYRVLKGRTDSFLREPLAIATKVLEEQLRLALAAGARGPAGDRSRRLSELARVFGLSPQELAVLEFLYLAEVDPEVAQLANADELEMKNIAKSVRNYCRVFRLTPRELREVLSRDSMLCRGGLVLRSSRDANEISASDHIVSYLSGATDDLIDKGLLKRGQRNSRIRLCDFSLPVRNKDVMRALLRSRHGASLLLYGVPGAGKTEFAGALVRDAGLVPYFVSQTDASGEEDLDFRKSALVAAQSLLPPEAVLIVDECDPIVNTKAGLFDCDRDRDDDGKSWINHYLETSKHKTIWISNKVDGIDDSTQRRFSYAQAFRVPDVKQRRRVWELQASIQKASFLTPEKRAQLAAAYEVSPGNVALALRDAAQMDGDAVAKTQCVENILGQKQLLSTGRKPTRAPAVTSRYSLASLNADYPLDSLRDSVRGFLNGMERGESEFRNLHVLLMGPPGTGKTEYVKALAAQSGKELLVKRTSDILGPYVGMTEKGIASAFAEAEDRGAILFLDEADSLFIDRSGADRSWEVSQTNEFLTQMEAFQGVLICATNFQDSLDVAAMRRFTFKVKFDYLRPEAQLGLFRRYFPEVRLDPEHCFRILQLKGLAHGDFKVAWQKASFRKDLGAGTLIEFLEQEAKLRTGRGKRAVQGLGSGL